MKTNRFNFITALKQFLNFENYDENKSKIIQKKINKNMSKIIIQKKE